jgi:hypothetical protein
VIVVDDSTKKKAGRQIAGVDRYRHGAGTARQAYRTLRGLPCVGGLLRVPLRPWPSHGVRVPIGLSLYRQEVPARKLQLPYRSRSALARELLDFVAAQLPDRQLQGRSDGGYATKDYLQGLPACVPVVWRMRLTGNL